MLALFLADQALRFVLQDNMVRMLHATMDDMKWKEESTHHYKSEITTSVLCKNGKVMEVEVEVDLVKRDDWEEGYNHVILHFQVLRSQKIKVSVSNLRDGRVSFEIRCHYDLFGLGIGGDDARMCALREKLMNS